MEDSFVLIIFAFIIGFFIPNIMSNMCGSILIEGKKKNTTSPCTGLNCHQCIDKICSNKNADDCKTIITNNRNYLSTVNGLCSGSAHAQHLVGVATHYLDLPTACRGDNPRCSQCIQSACNYKMDTPQEKVDCIYDLVNNPANENVLDTIKNTCYTEYYNELF